MKSDPRHGAGLGAPASGLYVHVPFCKSKCPYCDFYSVVSGAAIPRWLAALVRETAMRSGELGARGAFDTLYVGGGTPSALGGGEMERLVAIITAAFDLLPETEATIEVNPDDVTAEAASRWRALGLNRASLGTQSFDDGALRFLRRRHDAARAREAFRLLRKAGFSNIGIDLIYGFEGQSMELWRRTLEAALELAPEHLSCYQLSIERSTEFGRMLEAGTLTAIDEETQRSFFIETSAILTAHGYLHYEVSNFARSCSLKSSHNSKYWSRAPYLGLGPSAHSFDGQRRWWNPRSVTSYCEALERGADPLEDSETLDEERISLETLALGFRTREGVALDALRRGPGWERTLATLVEEGLVTIEGGRAVPTTAGLCVADRLAEAFAG